MAEKKPYFVGNVRLSDLAGFEDTVKNGVRGCFIPYDLNPSLYVGLNKQTGVMTLDVDILVRETTASKSGSSHFIKLNVGRANRERFQMGPEALDSLKIVGNLYTRIPGQTASPQGGYRQGPPARQAASYGMAPQTGGAYAPQVQTPYPAAPSGPAAGYPGDMPDFGAQGQRAPEGQQGAGW